MSQSGPVPMVHTATGIAGEADIKNQGAASAAGGGLKQKISITAFRSNTTTLVSVNTNFAVRKYEFRAIVSRQAPVIRFKH